MNMKELEDGVIGHIAQIFKSSLIQEVESQLSILVLLAMLTMTKSPKKSENTGNEKQVGLWSNVFVKTSPATSLNLFLT